MKNFRFVFAFALLVLFSSCGPSAEQLKQIADFTTTVSSLGDSESAMGAAVDGMKSKLAEFRADSTLKGTKADSLLAIADSKIAEYDGLYAKYKTFVTEQKGKLDGFKKELPTLEALKTLGTELMAKKDEFTGDVTKIQGDFDSAVAELTKLKEEMAVKAAEMLPKKK
ncbi:MAG: hypothetical protein SFU91_14775 [Chloroherpetonaceae bacterium]|nr:hypothetical protein [Chloroherpetonaceae bacterium]